MPDIENDRNIDIVFIQFLNMRFAIFEISRTSLNRYVNYLKMLGDLSRMVLSEK